MKKYGYKALLLALRSLMAVKRAGVWLFGKVWLWLTVIDRAYRNTIGFRIYKAFFSIKRGLLHWLPTRAGGMAEFFGRRGTLQCIIFTIALVLMIPHSRLYGRDAYAIPGRQTLLYSLVGPGDQDFQTEEVIVDITNAVVLKPNTPTWREGAVSQGTGASSGQTAPGEPQELSSISAGGSALTKPTILPGNTIGSQVAGAARKEIVLYEVQPGDVIGAIAGRFGLDISTILWANNLTIRSYIRPGDKLAILPMDGVVHTVKKNDTVQKIAKLYSAKADEIISFNKLQADGSDLVVAENLIIPGGRKTVAAVPQPAAARRFTVLSQIAAPPGSALAPGSTGYLWPAEVRRITQYYSWRHTGVDIAGPFGKAIYAARSGTVIRSQCGWNGGYGCHVIIDHGGGVQTLYAHAQQGRLFVNVGDFVEQGQTVAGMGSTGHSTGPHVHFEVRVNGRRVNPLQYVR
jgi:LysM repeat protein